MRRQETWKSGIFFDHFRTKYFGYEIQADNMSQMSLVSQKLRYIMFSATKNSLENNYINKPSTQIILNLHRYRFSHHDPSSRPFWANWVSLLLYHQHHSLRKSIIKEKGMTWYPGPNESEFGENYSQNYHFNGGGTASHHQVFFDQEQEFIEICHRLHVYDQDEAIKMNILVLSCRNPSREMNLSNHSSIIPWVVDLTINIMPWLEADMKEIHMRRCGK